MKRILKGWAMFLRFMQCRRGAAAILTALMFSVLLLVLALVVDIGRLYVVQNKAQQASDAALLGAVATAYSNAENTDPAVVEAAVNAEYARLFAANYPAGYMGSTIQNLNVSAGAGGAWRATFDAELPTLIMGVFNQHSTSAGILSEVTRGFGSVPGRQLELAMVLDNTGSMAGAVAGGGTKIQALYYATLDLIDIIFGEAETLNNVHISFVPYEAVVNVGSGRASWVQAPYVATYNSYAAFYGPGNGFLSNRHYDRTPQNAYNDISDAPPTSEETRFRIPTPFAGATCQDGPGGQLPPMRFALNSKSQLVAAAGTMGVGGCTRINVGLMWGWFTLSPNWRGVWGEPSAFPQDFAPETRDKALILMTDGLNTVYYGQNGFADDDVTTAQLCEAVKAQGITVYTVGLGANPSEVNETLLRDCASNPAYYWFAPTAADLRTAFRQIADTLLYSSIRLSQ